MQAYRADQPERYNQQRRDARAEAERKSSTAGLVVGSTIMSERHTSGTPSASTRHSGASSPGGTADEVVQLIVAAKPETGGNRLHALRTIWPQQAAHINRSPPSPSAATHRR